MKNSKLIKINQIDALKPELFSESNRQAFDPAVTTKSQGETEETLIELTLAPNKSEETFCVKKWKHKVGDYQKDSEQTIFSTYAVF